MRIELEKAIQEVKRRGAKRVGIQLPDGLRRRAFEIAEEIEKECNSEVIISGNTCFGACDIDFHLLEEVDVLLHFAHSRIGTSEKIIFVEVSHEFEFSSLLSEALPLLGRRVCVTTTAQHLKALGSVKRFLEENGKQVILKRSRRTGNLGEVLGCDFSAVERDADLLFIGTGDFHPLGISLFAEREVIAADPLKNEVSVVNGEKIRRKRYLLISKCLSFEKFGILVSTKVHQRRLNLARVLKKKAKERGLKAEIIMFDTILFDALQNFDAEAYVNTACPRITYDDTELHPKPLLTPDEFLVILGEKEFHKISMDQMH
ncbi:MAG: diphthamide biosynthesis enzyme Dph2 [Archaeoglobi archaeon]|nr:diphthamide biosynthesis enzyme Dph2 [Candidatus Mnemosynella sp.]